MDFEKLEISQYLMLILMFMMGGAILANVGAGAGTDIMVLYLVAMVAGLVFVCMFYRILVLYDFRSFPYIFEKCFGYWGGKILCVLYAFFYLVRTEVVAQSMTDMASDLLMNDAPRRLTMAILLFTTLYGCYKGLRALGRSAQILVPLLILCFLPFLLTVLQADAFSRENLHPMMTGSTQNFWLKTSSVAMFPFIEMPLLFGILSYKIERDKQRTLLRYGTIGTIISTLLLLGIGIINLSLLGKHLVSSLKYPFYNSMMLAGVHGVLERLDPLAVIIVITSGFYKVALLFYCWLEMVGALSQRLKRNWIIIFTAILLFFGAPNLSYMSEKFLTVTLPFKVMPLFQIMIPVSIWVIAEVKHYFRR